MTSPHVCQQCHEQITEPTGLRRTTIDCPACHNRTSIYAIHFLCSECNIRLESPVRMAGHRTTCPGCGSPEVVPRDVLHAEPPVDADENWFGINCRACNRPLAVRKADVGTLAVCPHCLIAIDVPRVGYQLTQGLWRAGKERSVGCPQCRMSFPARLAACPYCKRQSPIEPGEV